MRITRHIDELNRIVLPYEVLSKFGWSEKTQIDIEATTDNTVTLKTHMPLCKLCGNSGTNLIPINNAYLCHECLAVANESKKQ